MMKLAHVLGKKYPLMKKQVKKSFIWMKVALLSVCHAFMGMQKWVPAAMASMDWHARARVNVIGAIMGATFVTLSVFSS